MWIKNTYDDDDGDGVKTAIKNVEASQPQKARFVQLQRFFINAKR